ncbi:MAG: hypothetical protein NTY19_24305 [Planctomycetota bacterium]|nr:hypothetical protein [Planctomycetota bacterium]
MLWIHNPQSTWRTEHDGKQPRLQNLLLAKTPAEDGMWQVEWWDTFKGEVIRREAIQAAGGHLLLPVPDFTRDLAVKMQRAE